VGWWDIKEVNMDIKDKVRYMIWDIMVKGLVGWVMLEIKKDELRRKI
jgi:hypothetical protein